MDILVESPCIECPGFEVGDHEARVASANGGLGLAHHPASPAPARESAVGEVREPAAGCLELPGVHLAPKLAESVPRFLLRARVAGQPRAVTPVLSRPAPGHDPPAGKTAVRAHQDLLSRPKTLADGHHDPLQGSPPLRHRHRVGSCATVPRAACPRGNAVQSRLAREHTATVAARASVQPERIALAARHRRWRIVPQRIVIVEILTSRREAETTLSRQPLDRMPDQIRVAMVAKATRQTPHETVACLRSRAGRASRRHWKDTLPRNSPPLAAHRGLEIRGPLVHTPSSGGCWFGCSYRVGHQHVTLKPWPSGALSGEKCGLEGPLPGALLGQTLVTVIGKLAPIGKNLREALAQPVLPLCRLRFVTSSTFSVLRCPTMEEIDMAGTANTFGKIARHLVEMNRPQRTVEFTVREMIRVTNVDPPRRESIDHLPELRLDFFTVAQLLGRR